MALSLLIVSVAAAAAPAAAVQDYERLLAEETSILQALDELDEDLWRRAQDLDRLQEERQRVAVTLIELEVRFEGATRDLARTRDLVHKRLRAQIRQRRASGFDIVLGLQAFFDGQRRARVIGKLLESDSERVAAYREQLTAYESERSALDARRQELDSLEERVAAQKLELDRDRTARAEIVKRVEQERRFFEKAHRDLQRAHKDVTDRIARLQQWQGKRLTFSELRGQFRLPMSYAQIVTPYGPKPNPRLNTTTLHPGLEIRSRGSIKVRAIYWGRVAHVGWLTGYGQTVILDHTGGYYTVYARLGSVGVREGEVVETRQELGTIGGPSALGTPNTLYFELRQEGKAIDPAVWFQS